MRRVVRVWIDHRLCRAVTQTDVGLRCEFEPLGLQLRVRDQLGPPPYTPRVAEMESAIMGALLGVPWEDPLVRYQASAVLVVQDYVSHHLRGAEVPLEAAKAMLDMKDWNET